MKKKMLPQKNRQLLSVLIGLLLLCSAAGLIWSLLRPAEKAEYFNTYSFHHAAEVDYRVLLLPNEFFPEPLLGPGRAYISDLTDSVQSVFVYRFSGEKEAELRGEYRVLATLAAYTGQEKYLVWERKYELLPPKSFSTRGKEIAFQEEVAVPFSAYAEFAGRLSEETKFSPEELNLTVVYSVSVEAQTEEGTIREELNPTMVVPLKGKTFVVGGELAKSNAGGLSASRQVPVPLVKETKVAFGTATLFFIALMLGLQFLTAAREEKNNFVARKIAKLLKKHGERIVAVKKTPPLLEEGKTIEIEVDSFEDLLKTADELGRPILYCQADKTDGKEHVFVVMGENCLYRFVLGSG